MCFWTNNTVQYTAAQGVNNVCFYISTVHSARQSNEQNGGHKSCQSSAWLSTTLFATLCFLGASYGSNLPSSCSNFLFKKCLLSLRISLSLLCLFTNKPEHVVWGSGLNVLFSKMFNKQCECKTQQRKEMQAFPQSLLISWIRSRFYRESEGTVV